MLDGRMERWFARYWNRQLRSENPRFRAMRSEVAGGARGRVLEVGCGPGSNFEHYGAGVTRFVALDPNPHMLAFTRGKRLSDRPFDIVRARAEALPFQDGVFETIVSTANFCSVQRPAEGLAEIRRTLRSGGEYRFFDHVRADGTRLLAFFQDVITPLHRRLLGTGCHLNRRVGRLVEGAGFDSVEIKIRKPLPVLMALYGTHIIGVARR